MDVEHTEDVVCGRQHHLAFAREDHRLQHVCKLGDIGHLQPVCILVEDVQAQCGHHGITHRVLLVQVTWVVSGFYIEPRSPFVQEQGDTLFRVIGIHHGDVAAKEILHLDRLAQHLVVFGRSEIDGRSLGVPVHHCVVVERHRLHRIACICHKHTRPVVVVAIGSGGNLIKLIAVEVPQICLIPLIYIGIVLGRHISAAAPGLIAHPEVFELPGLLAAVLCTELCLVAALRGDVFHPFSHLLHGAGAHISGEVRFDAQALAEVHELVRAEGVVLHSTAPVAVHHLGTGFTGADAVAPVIVVGKTAAGPAEHWDLESTERLHHIDPITVHVGDVGIRSNPDAFVYASAQMLGELAVDLRGNNFARRGFMDCYLHLGVKEDRYRQKAQSTDNSFHKE